MQFSLLSPILRVSDVTRHLREIIQADELLSDVWVQGEVSNANHHSSGHFYFSLKDEHAALRAVMWKRDVARVPRLPRDGEAVYVHGYISVYEARGDVQLYADELELVGTGALWLEFEALKQKLAAEGLFDAERKRPLPRFPRRIGIVTSPTGAVFHDMKRVLERRYPLVEIFFAPCAVQGAEAPLQIMNALARLQRLPSLDAIILARGGGSLEDLWAFNDERVARAIAASPVPVITGIGHETDFTIADFVADVRAPTPTAAAELCTPDRAELRAQLRLSERRMRRSIRDALAAGWRRYADDVRALRRLSPRAQILDRRQQLDELARASTALVRKQIALQRARLLGATRHLEALNPWATLERGYAIVRKDGRVITSPTQVVRDDLLDIRVRGGAFTARVS